MRSSSTPRRGWRKTAAGIESYPSFRVKGSDINWRHGQPRPSIWRLVDGSWPPTDGGWPVEDAKPRAMDPNPLRIFTRHQRLRLHAREAPTSVAGCGAGRVGHRRFASATISARHNPTRHPPSETAMDRLTRRHPLCAAPRHRQQAHFKKLYASLPLPLLPPLNCV